MDLAGQTAVVTGAARGMGQAIAEALAARGATVALWGRTQSTLEAAAVGIGRGAFAVQGDMGRPEDIRSAFDATLARTGRIDVLVCNAGISGPPAPFLDLEEASWAEMLAVNLTGPMLASQLTARAMAAQGGGVILLNASIAASGVDGEYSHYSASKAGLLALMRSMAVELAPCRIRVNAVSPGYVETEMTTGAFEGEALARLRTDFSRVPLRRLVTAEEVAAAFAFLASPAASGITGTNIVVDGGLTANLYITETLAP